MTYLKKNIKFLIILLILLGLSSHLNFAIAGGFIIIFVYGPDKYSIDYMLKSKQK